MTIVMLVPACVSEQQDGASEQTASPQDWEPEFVDGELQPLPDGFPEQEITIVNVDVAGSRDGLYARALDKVLADISPVDIVVSDEPATQGGTVATLADVPTRQGGAEGYFLIVTSVGGTASDFHTSPLEEELGLTLDDINFLVATETHPRVMAQRADAPWGSGFADFVEYGKQHPGELRYVSSGVGGGLDLTMEWMLHQLGIEVQKVPAADRQAAVAAVGAGEADFTMVQLTDVVAAEEAGRVDPVFFTTEQVPDEWANTGAASAQDYDEFGLPDAPWGITLGLMLPTDVPDSHDRWLYTLIKAAYESDRYGELRDQVPGLQQQLLSTAEVNEVARDGYKFTEPIFRRLGLHHEDQ